MGLAPETRRSSGSSARPVATKNDESWPGVVDNTAFHAVQAAMTMLGV